MPFRDIFSSAIKHKNLKSAYDRYLNEETTYFKLRNKASSPEVVDLGPRGGAFEGIVDPQK